jgi:hypothetical protein
MLSIAKNFAWMPHGMIIDEQMANWTKDYKVHFRPTYDPEELGHCKRVSDEDAHALSEALLRANAEISAGNLLVTNKFGPILFRDDMTAADFENVNSGIESQLSGLITFASGGSFAFAWDD